LSIHKAPAVRAAIESVGSTLLFLAPNSPDFNPIEQAFSKLKAHLCRAAEHTTYRLSNAIGLPHPRPLLPAGTRKLLRRLRLRCRMIENRSN
jgi:transposase